MHFLFGFVDTKYILIVFLRLFCLDAGSRSAENVTAKANGLQFTVMVAPYLFQLYCKALILLGQLRNEPGAVIIHFTKQQLLLV